MTYDINWSRRQKQLQMMVVVVLTVLVTIRLRWWVFKMQGVERIPPNSVPPPWRHSFMSLFQATLCIGFLAYFSSYWSKYEDRVLIVASFGASAVLVHSAVKSPLAQPRNLVLGHMVSGLTGVTVYKVRFHPSGGT